MFNMQKIIYFKCLYYLRKITSYSVEKGEKFSTTIVKQATDITYEMLQKYLFKFCIYKKP